MPQRKSQFQVWYEMVKRDLLRTEPNNILARAECCKKIIDKCVASIDAQLSLPSLSLSQQYECRINPTEHLSFLINWPGLRTDASAKLPKNKKEYEKKSKNWLNGRRAPNYGKTLFPFFIASAESYIANTAKILIGGDNCEAQQKMYYDIVMYDVLAKLCACTVSLHEQAKKAPFFCKNSVERKGKLKSLLQSYASDHEYIQGFPSCFEEAVGYFKKKSAQYLSEYQCQYMNVKPMATIKYKQEIKSNNLNELAVESSDIYWQQQVTALKQQVAMEQAQRQKVEKERDYLRRQLVNNPRPRTYANCESWNNSTGSTLSTSSASAPVTPMINTNSYQRIPSFQSNHCPRNTHVASVAHAPPPIPTVNHVHHVPAYNYAQIQHVSATTMVAPVPSAPPCIAWTNSTSNDMFMPNINSLGAQRSIDSFPGALSFGNSCCGPSPTHVYNSPLSHNNFNFPN